MYEPTVDVALLEELLAAFNSHDVDAIMDFFHEDCVMDTPRGPAPGGSHLVGKERVREGIEARFAGIPDVHYGEARHWVSGDRGASEWTITGTEAGGEPVKVRGCDLFEFRDGRISRKDVLEDHGVRGAKSLDRTSQT